MITTLIFIIFTHKYVHMHVHAVRKD